MTPFVGLSMTDHVLVVDLSGENAGPSAPLRFAQDDTFCEFVYDEIMVVDLSGEDAGPSTPLRSAQDDTFYFYL